MNYLKKELGSYKLHMIKTDKFKTIKVRICFRRKVKKEEITIRNILCDMLAYSSLKYPTKRELAIKSQDLYAASVNFNNVRLGNYINTEFNLTTLNDKYTEEGNFNKSLEFLYELIYNPNVKDNKFNEDILKIVLTDAKTSLESLKEDASLYSIIRLLENMDKESIISYRGVGYLEDLDNINSSNLYKYYKSMIEKDLMDIFIIGNIDFEEIETLIKKYFPVKTFKKLNAKYIVEEGKVKARKKTVIEKEENSQSKLAIGCRLVGLSTYERNYPLTLYNIILGAGDKSKLFREVREKNSLCYYINSVPNKLDNLIIIRAGIDSNNIKKTISIVEKQLNLMKKGKFSEEDLKIAKEYYMTALDDVSESESSLIDTYFMMEILNIDDIETRRKKMAKVTSEEIIKVAKKVKIDTVYCLEGTSK